MAARGRDRHGICEVVPAWVSIFAALAQIHVGSWRPQPRRAAGQRGLRPILSADCLLAMFLSEIIQGTAPAKPISRRLSAHSGALTHPIRPLLGCGRGLAAYIEGESSSRRRWRTFEKRGSPNGEKIKRDRSAFAPRQA